MCLAFCYLKVRHILFIRRSSRLTPPTTMFRPRQSISAIHVKIMGWGYIPLIVEVDDVDEFLLDEGIVDLEALAAEDHRGLAGSGGARGMHGGEGGG